jgi:hypothetical protein
MLENERGAARRERERKKKEIGEIPGSHRCCFPFLFKPWQSGIGLLPALCWVICKNLPSRGL